MLECVIEIINYEIDTLNIRIDYNTTVPNEQMYIIIEKGAKK